MSSATVLYGADVQPIDDAGARHCVEWVLGLKDEPAVCADARWAVLLCELALVWAVRQGDRWVLACADDEAVGKPTLGSLREARVFGPKDEALIWNSGSGLVGRVLRDAPGVPDYPLAPFDQVAEFEQGKGPGSCSSPTPNGFVVRQAESGRTTVTPGGTGVKVRQYLSEDGGLLRIAATRFVEVV